MSFDNTARYKDRIEPSNSSLYNPYRQDPWAMRTYQAKQAQGSDRLETSQERLERELLEKFRRNHYKLPKGSLLMLAQVGKTLLLVVFLPPYFVGYLLPIWIFQKMLLPAAKVLEKGNEFVEKLAFRISAWSQIIVQTVQKKLKSLFQRKKIKEASSPNLFQELYNHLKEKVKELKIPERLQVMKKTFAQLKNQLAEKNYQLLQNFYKKSKQQMFARYTAIKEKTIALTKAHILKIQAKVLEKLKPFIAAAKFVDRTLDKTFKAMVKPFEIAYKKTAEWIAPVKPFLAAVVSGMIAPFAPIPRWIEKRAVSLNQRIESMAKTTQSIAQSAKQMVMNQLSALGERGVLLLTPFANFVKSAALKSAQTAKKKAAVVKKAMERLVRFVLDKGKEQAKKVKVIMERMGDKIKKASLHVLQFAKKTPSYLWNILKALFALLISFWKVYFKALRLLYSWTKVLTRYSFEKILERI